MQMSGKTAVIFGGSGAIGRAAARVLARQGAQVHLVARGKARLDRVVADIAACSGKAEALVADVLDEQALTAGIAGLVGRKGAIDVVINATGFPHDQGKDLSQLSQAEFRGGFEPFLLGAFHIAKASAPHMGGMREGAMITIVPPAAGLALPGHLGHVVGCAGVEAFSRVLASELGPRNIRVLCLRSHAIQGAIQAGSHTGGIFAPKATAMGLSVEDWLGGAAQGTMLKRLPTLEQVAETIAFLASGHAGAMTAAVVNMTAGAVAD